MVCHPPAHPALRVDGGHPHPPLAACSPAVRARARSYEIALLLIGAYSSYGISEALALSGIMALFFCGVVLAHYNW